VRRGAPKPDVSTPDALKRALLAAKSIGYTSPTGGGITVAPILKLLDTLDIAAAVAPKTKFAAGGPNGRVSVLVSSGEAEIGLQQVSELMSNPDVEVIGMLPPEWQRFTIYSAGITADAKQPAAARALIQFLAKPEAKAIYKTKGLAL
jgi:molybdate transport system substrate-binding protein